MPLFLVAYVFSRPHRSTLDYNVMWQAIQGQHAPCLLLMRENAPPTPLPFSIPEASGRAMVLTTEGNPNNTACSAIGGCGNAKRVGHDIGASWNNVRGACRDTERASSSTQPTPLFAAPPPPSLAYDGCAGPIARRHRFWPVALCT